MKECSKEKVTDTKCCSMTEAVANSLIVKKFLAGEPESLVVRDLIDAGYPESLTEGQVRMIKKSMSEVIVI